MSQKHKKVDKNTVKKKLQKRREEIGYVINKDIEFWNIHKKTDKNDNTTTTYSFNYSKFIDFLDANNFYRYEIDHEKYIFIRVENQIVREVSETYIKDIVLKVAENEDAQVYEMLLRYTIYITKTLPNMRIKKLVFEKSGYNFQWMFFKNFALKITRKGVEKVKYEKLENNIWKDNIIDFEPKYLKDFISIDNHLKDQDLEYFFFNFHENRGDFLQYLINTSNEYWRSDKEVSNEQEAIQHTHLMNKLTAMGYLLHTYRDPSLTYSVIANDLAESEVGDSNGGTGKSLLGEAMKIILSTVVINGKKKDLFSDNFLFEEVDEVTNLIFFDDIRMNFDFDELYPIITGRLTINKKGIGKYTLESTDTPKIYITTNHTVKCESNSDRRRQFHIGFSDYYNGNRNPYSEFRRNMFSQTDWDYEQWNCFYNTMIYAIQFWLKYGRIEVPGINIAKRRLRQIMGEDFIEWAEGFFLPGTSTELSNLNQAFEKKELFEKFVDSLNVASKKYQNSRNFKKKIKAFCEYKGYVFNPSKKGDRIIKNSKEYYVVGILDTDRNVKNDENNTLPF